MDFTEKQQFQQVQRQEWGFCSLKTGAELGGNVVMCDVNKEVLNKCVEEINAKGKGRV